MRNMRFWDMGAVNELLPANIFELISWSQNMGSITDIENRGNSWSFGKPFQKGQFSTEFKF